MPCEQLNRHRDRSTSRCRGLAVTLAVPYGVRMTDVLPVDPDGHGVDRTPIGGLGPRRSTPKLLADEILGWIERGEYKPSDPLPSERDLQQRFGVSRVVVRDALVRLQAVGLIRVEQGRGCFVSDALIDWSSGPFRVWMDTHQYEIINLLKLRRALDALAAEETASDHDAAALRVVAAAEQAFADEANADADPVRLASLDKAFHASIAQAGGMTIIAHLLHELDDHSANMHRTTMSLAGRPGQSVHDHRAIVSALAAGDPAAARVAAEAHVDGTIAQVRSIIALRTPAKAG